MERLASSQFESISEDKKTRMGSIGLSHLALCSQIQNKQNQTHTSTSYGDPLLFAKQIRDNIDSKQRNIIYSFQTVPFMATTSPETGININKWKAESTHVQNLIENIDLLPSNDVLHHETIFQGRVKQSSQRGLLEHQEDILQLSH